MEKTDIILRQYVTIQHSGVTNMFDYKAVLYYADAVNFHELFALLDDMGKRKYPTFLFGLTEEELSVEPYEDVIEELCEV